MTDQQLSNMVYVRSNEDFSRRPVKPGERADNLPRGYTLVYAGPQQPDRLAAIRDAFGPVSTVRYAINGLRFTTPDWTDGEPHAETPYHFTWSVDIGIAGGEHDPQGELEGDPESTRKRGEARVSVFDLYRCTHEMECSPAAALDIDGSMEQYASVLDDRHSRLRDDLADQMLGAYTDGSPCIESLILVADLRLHWPCRSAGLGREVITRTVRTLRPNGYVLVAMPVVPVQFGAEANEKASGHPTRNPYRLDMLSGDEAHARARIASRYESDGWTYLDGVLYRVYHDGHPVQKDA